MTKGGIICLLFPQNSKHFGSCNDKNNNNEKSQDIFVFGYNRWCFSVKIPHTGDKASFDQCG